MLMQESNILRKNLKYYSNFHDQLDQITIALHMII